MDKTSLGDRMKQYEAVPKNFLLRRTPVIIRLDGKAFHTFTRGFDKPFDEAIELAMETTMLCLCQNIQGGDAIKLVDWLVEEFHDKNVNFKFHFHSMNPVGVQNMKNAVEKYWEVY